MKQRAIRTLVASSYLIFAAAVVPRIQDLIDYPSHATRVIQCTTSPDALTAIRSLTSCILSHLLSSNTQSPRNLSLSNFFPSHRLRLFVFSSFHFHMLCACCGRTLYIVLAHPSNARNYHTPSITRSRCSTCRMSGSTSHGGAAAQAAANGPGTSAPTRPGSITSAGPPIRIRPSGSRRDRSRRLLRRRAAATCGLPRARRTVVYIYCLSRTGCDPGMGDGSGRLVPSSSGVKECWTSRTCERRGASARDRALVLLIAPQKMCSVSS